MKLYYTKGACSLAARIIINELALTCEYEAVDLKTKRTEKNQDFLQINPKGAVPTLETKNGEILTENAVIQQYLAEEANATQLLPMMGDFKRYRVLEWLNYVATELHKGFGPLFNPSVDKKTKDEIFIPLLQAKFNYIDQQLQSKPFLLDTFTLPDAYLFVMIFWSLHFKFPLSSSWPHLSRYFTQLQTRQSIQHALNEEGLTIK